MGIIRNLHQNCVMDQSNWSRDVMQPAHPAMPSLVDRAPLAGSVGAASLTPTKLCRVMVMMYDERIRANRRK